jgi:hypothetical protein
VTDRDPDWNVATDNYGVQKVTHRHGDVEALADVVRWSEHCVTIREDAERLASPAPAP